MKQLHDTSCICCGFGYIEVRSTEHALCPGRKFVWERHGAAMRREREKAGLSVRAAAKQLGMDASNLSKAESGRARPFPVSYRKREPNP